MKTGMFTGLLLAGLLGFLCAFSVSGQDKSIKYDLVGLLQNNKLDSFNRGITMFSENDKKGIRFSRNTNDGIAWLLGVEFSNGTIEVDIRGKDVFQQSFVGIAFHEIGRAHV
jgi:hypothetical protein